MCCCCWETARRALIKRQWRYGADSFENSSLISTPFIHWCFTIYYRFHQLGKTIRRAWSSKYNDFLLRLENPTSHIRISEKLSNSSRDVPAQSAREFHRRAIRSLALERKALCRHSVETRNSLTTFLELMLDLDASVYRHELLCHVLSYGWDYMARASNEGSLFVQQVSKPFLCFFSSFAKIDHLQLH